MRERYIYIYTHTFLALAGVHVYKWISLCGERMVITMATDVEQNYAESHNTTAIDILHSLKTN